MPQQLDRDPNALSTLLRGQTQIPRYTEEEESLQSMIPEEQLYQMQDAQSDAGRARGGPYSVSSRDSLRESGVAGLKQLLGLQQAKGQAAAYPNRVAGEYDLQEARIKGNYDVESAKQKAVADSAQHGRNQQFQTEHQGRQQTFQGGQNDLNRAAVDRNTAASIAGRKDVALEGTNRALLTQDAITDRKTGGKNEYWGPEALGPLWDRMFGSSDPAADSAPDAAVSPAIAQQVATLRRNPKAAGLTAQQLFEQGVGAGSTPEEMAAFASLWDGGQ